MKEEYTLWFIPAREVYDTLAALIAKLGKEYATPNFEPHITLLGDIKASEKDVLSKTKELAAFIKPFEVKLSELDYLDEYFRCLFIKAEQSEAMTNANVKARELFGRQQDPPFMPHVSILYGDYQNEIKEKITSDIGKSFNLTFQVFSLHLVLASSNIDPKDWRRIKEFPLVV